MESSGISIISARPLQTEENGHLNQAFDSSDLTKEGSITNNNTIGNGERVLREIPPTKGDSSTVEFPVAAKSTTVEFPVAAKSTTVEFPVAAKSTTVEFPVPAKRESKERFQSLSNEPYRGMGKEELLRFSSRPLWRNLRYVCMSTVLTGWLALLITVVALVLTYPACRKAQEREWWQKAVIYRLYVRSFYDTDTDGIGDINGIRQKLDYLHNLGVDTISLSPIYKLAQDAPTDTHIVDHTDIDAVYGTLHDFKVLVNETHRRGMHITLDFIPNHTSDQHPWFLASKNNSDARQNEFRTFYVWASGRGVNGVYHPNNWTTVENCSSSWSWTEDNLYYLHQFMNSQPDLNLRSAKVREALENVLRFWLDLGVDGFYIRDSDYLFEDYDLRDNVDNAGNLSCSENKDSGNDSKFTRGLSEIFDMFARWRSFLDEYGNKTSRYRILFADVDGSYEHVRNYYGLFNRDGVDFPLNTFSLQLNISALGDGIRKMVSSWMDNMSNNNWPNWMGGDDRSERLVDRLEEMAGPYLIISMLLPGTPYFYYGDEIGMRSVSNVTDETQLPFMALPMRGPLQWNNKTFAGFCPQYCNHPWMTIHPEYKNQMNVEAQMKNPESLWNLFRNLTMLRKDIPSFEYGDYITAIQDEDVFSFVREYDGEKGYLVVLNFADRAVNRNYMGIHETIPSSAKVEIVTGSNAYHRTSGSANLKKLALNAFEGIVVSWDYHAKEL